MSSFSAVIPLKNMVRSIEACVASILAQSATASEIIVVDDGSTDGSGDRVAETYRDIRLIRSAGLGAGAARNLGAKEATAPWLAFLDADDEWRPDFLAEVEAALAKFPDAVAIFTELEIRGPHPVVPTPPTTVPSVIEDYFAFVTARSGLGMHPSCTAVRRDAFLAVGGFLQGIPTGEDQALWARLACAGPIVFIPLALAVYNYAPDEAGRGLIYPVFAKALKRQAASGEVPARLMRSSQAFATGALFDHVIELHAAGRNRDARKVLFTDLWPPSNIRRFAGTALRFLIPSVAYRRLRGFRESRRPAAGAPGTK